MKKLKELLISPDATIYQAIKGIDKGALQIMLVVDSDNHLLGSVSDGDVRRGLLKKHDLNSPVSIIMNPSPISASYGTARNNIIALMHEKMVHCIPVTDKNNRIVGLETDERLLWSGIENTPVVLMAGGLGMRLRPLTEHTPKPLLPVGGTPILERILVSFLEQGFRIFYISVNYKSDMFRQHFGDGSTFGCKIHYLQEKRRLGTAGALGLLPKNILPKNIIVMNGDLLTTVDFRQLLDFHKDTSACASMCVRDYSIQVPYGVVEVDGHKFKSIKEKPAHQYYINAGIYALSTSILKSVPQDVFFDITDLFELLKKSNAPVSVFPMRENWLDIGNIDEYERANSNLNRGNI